MKLRSYQIMNVLGFVDQEILIVFCDHQLTNRLYSKCQMLWSLQWLWTYTYALSIYKGLDFGDVWDVIVFTYYLKYDRFISIQYW